MTSITRACPASPVTHNRLAWGQTTVTLLAVTTVAAAAVVLVLVLVGERDSTVLDGPDPKLAPWSPPADAIEVPWFGSITAPEPGLAPVSEEER